MNYDCANILRWTEAQLKYTYDVSLQEATPQELHEALGEAMTVLAFFTPAAIPGLSIGCLLFNLTYSATLPLDFVVGTLATFLAAWGMWKTRNVLLGKLPVLGLTMPAITNAFLVGWELTQYIGGGFVINAVYVALGELAVVMVLGTMLYLAVKHRGLQKNMLAA